MYYICNPNEMPKRMIVLSQSITRAPLYISKRGGCRGSRESQGTPRKVLCAAEPRRTLMNRSNERKRCRRLVAPLRVRWRVSAARLAALHARFFLHDLLSRQDVRSRFSFSLLGRRDLLTRRGASVHGGYARWESQTSARETRESITPCIFTHNSEHEWLMKNIWITNGFNVIVGSASMLNYYLRGRDGRKWSPICITCFATDDCWRVCW